MNTPLLSAGEAIFLIVVLVLVGIAGLLATAVTYYAQGRRAGQREEWRENLRRRRLAWKQLTEAHPEAVKFYRYWL